VELREIIDARACTVALSSTTKDQCVRELAELISAGLEEVTPDELHRALMEREEAGSTGFEDGVAIPHARLPQVSEFVFGIAVSKRGIDYDSVDGKRTRLFFVLVGPAEDPQQYLQLLAQISRTGLNRRLHEELLASPTRQQLADAFAAHLQPTAVRAPAGSARIGDRLLFVVVYEQRYFDDIVTLFLERGIRGAAVFDTKGIRGHLTSVPIFGDFLNFLGEKSEMSKTIMAVVPAGEFDRLIAGIEEITGDLDAHADAAILAIDLAFSKGSLERA
jgi:mannitol/fructose-specific phosphotransferase system IIA component (Ntr-type)